MGAAAMFFFKTLWFGVISIACSGIYFYVTIKKYSNQIITAWEIKASQDNNPKINIDN
jgi:protein associated with RNAse G/E